MDGDLTFDISRNLAARLNIPLVIAGLSPEQVERILGLKSFETHAPDERQARTRSAGFDLREIYTNQELRKYWWDGTACRKDQVPRVVYPFYAWPYDEDLIRQSVVELELIDPGHDNPLITNNDTIPLMLAVDVCKMGYAGFEPEFAQLIRSGRSERAPWLAVFEAVEYLSYNGSLMPSCVDDTLGHLDLDRDDVGIPAGNAKIG
jgi:hypothetical protein